MPRAFAARGVLFPKKPSAPGMRQCNRLPLSPGHRMLAFTGDPDMDLRPPPGCSVHRPRLELLPPHLDRRLRLGALCEDGRFGTRTTLRREYAAQGALRAG